MTKKHLFPSLMLFAIEISGISAFSQSVTPRDVLQDFHWSSKECPQYKDIAEGQWDPNSFLDLKKRLDGCTIQKDIFKTDKQRPVELIHYSYHFMKSKEVSGLDSDGIEKHEYYFLVSIPSNHIIWDDAKTNLGTGGGSFEYIKIHQIKNNLICELQFFTGGTGGYWEEYYTIKGEHLAPLGQSFIQEAESIVPEGFHVNRVRVDIDNLIATIYLATNKDGNHFPSGRLELKLALQDENLSFVSGSFYTQ